MPGVSLAGHHRYRCHIWWTQTVSDHTHCGRWSLSQQRKQILRQHMSSLWSCLLSHSRQMMPTYPCVSTKVCQVGWFSFFSFSFCSFQKPHSLSDPSDHRQQELQPRQSFRTSFMTTTLLLVHVHVHELPTIDKLTACSINCEQRYQLPPKNMYCSTNMYRKNDKITLCCSKLNSLPKRSMRESDTVTSRLTVTIPPTCSPISNRTLTGLARTLFCKLRRDARFTPSTIVSHHFTFQSVLMGISDQKAITSNLT